MIVVVETNFVLELVIEQAEATACQRILDLAREATSGWRSLRFRSLRRSKRSRNGAENDEIFSTQTFNLTFASSVEQFLSLNTQISTVN